MKNLIYLLMAIFALTSCGGDDDQPIEDTQFTVTKSILENMYWQSITTSGTKEMKFENGACRYIDTDYGKIRTLRFPKYEINDDVIELYDHKVTPSDPLVIWYRAKVQGKIVNGVKTLTFTPLSEVNILNGTFTQKPQSQFSN